MTSSNLSSIYQVIIENDCTGLPNAKTLFDEGDQWRHNLRHRGFTKDGRLTIAGRLLYSEAWSGSGPGGQSQLEWMKHDLRLAPSIIDNQNAGIPDQLTVNAACKRLTLLSLVATDRTLESPTTEILDMLQRSKVKLEESYRDLRRSLYNDARHDVSLRPQWVTAHENKTLAVIEAAFQLRQLLSHLPPSSVGTSSPRTGDRPSIVPED